MKGLIVLAICAIAATAQAGLSEQQVAKLQEYYRQCTADTGVDATLIEKARKGDFTPDEKLQKYYFCMLNKAQILDDNAVLQVDVLKSKMPADIPSADADKLIALCKDKKGKDKYESAYQIYECYFKAAPSPTIFSFA